MFSFGAGLSKSFRRQGRVEMGRQCDAYRSWKGLRPILWVALAFEAQLVDELPCEPHDLAVGAIVTEARVLRLQ